MKFDYTTGYYIPFTDLTQHKLDVLRELLNLKTGRTHSPDYYNIDIQGGLVGYHPTHGFGTWSDGGRFDYRDNKLTFGEFADLIDSYEKPIMLNGRQVVFHKGYIEVGCTKVTNEEVRMIQSKLIN